MNPATLNNIANAVFPKIATSLDLSEIIELLGGITDYTIGETASFHLMEVYRQDVYVR